MKGNTANVTLVNRPTLPLSALILSPENARKSRDVDVIESIAASLRVVGMIHNIVVVPSAKKDGPYEVIAGGNRLLASQLRLKNGEIGPNEPIPYDLRTREEATEISLHENIAREEMHPADEYEAIAKMYGGGKGMSIDRIADALRVTPLVVERRLALANASPKLFDLFRRDEISTDQLMALCATDDHERQESVWENVPEWDRRNPKALRRMVLDDSEIDASSDKRVAFIGGIEVYRAAGGGVRRDLFTAAQENAGFIADEALLAKLVAEKLEGAAEEVRAEGWGWVEVSPAFDGNAFNRLGRLEVVVGELPPEARAEADKLDAEAQALVVERTALENLREDLTEEQEERYNQIEDRLQAISDELEGIDAEHATYPADAKPLAGAWVVIHDGKLRIERGLVKPEDRKKLVKAGAAAKAVSGGRETAAAGRKNGDTLSDPLRRSLFGRRNHAAQIAVANNVRVAKVLMAMVAIDLVGERRFTYGGDSLPSDLSLREGGGTRTHHEIQGEDADALDGELETILQARTGKLPTKSEALWDFLAAKSDDELDAIIACGVGASISLDRDHDGVTAKLLGALHFDVSAHVRMSADNYFGRVSKPLIFAALKEAGQDHGRDALEKFKKGDLAREAEKRLHDSGWVPKLIRTPAPKVEKAKAAAAGTKPAKGKSAAKKAPAKKAPTKTVRKAKPAKKAGKAKR